MNMHHSSITVRKSKLNCLLPDISSAFRRAQDGDPKLAIKCVKYLLFAWCRSSEPDCHLVKMHHPRRNFVSIHKEVCRWNKVLDIILMVGISIPFDRILYFL